MIFHDFQSCIVLCLPRVGVQWRSPRQARLFRVRSPILVPLISLSCSRGRLSRNRPLLSLVISDHLMVILQRTIPFIYRPMHVDASLNFIRLLRVVITPSVKSESTGCQCRPLTSPTPTRIIIHNYANV